MNRTVQINALVTIGVFLLIWIIIYLVWGASSNNFLSRLFETPTIRVSYDLPLDGAESLRSSGGGAAQTINQDLSDSSEKNKPKRNGLTVIVRDPSEGKVRAQQSNDQTPVASSGEQSTTQANVDETPTQRQANNQGLAEPADSAQSASILAPLVESNPTDEVADSDADIQAAAVNTVQTSTTPRSSYSDGTSNSSPDISRDRNPEPRIEASALMGKSVGNNSANEAAPAPRKVTLALQLKLIYNPDQCSRRQDKSSEFEIDIFFRLESAAIKGFSLLQVDDAVQIYSKCQPAMFSIARNNQGNLDATDSLIQRRQDELVYYLMHMRVNKDDILFQEKS